MESYGYASPWKDLTHEGSEKDRTTEMFEMKILCKNVDKLNKITMYPIIKFNLLIRKLTALYYYINHRERLIYWKKNYFYRLTRYLAKNLVILGFLILANESHRSSKQFLWNEISRNDVNSECGAHPVAADEVSSRSIYLSKDLLFFLLLETILRWWCGQWMRCLSWSHLREISRSISLPKDFLF